MKPPKLNQRQKIALKYIRDCLEYNYAPSYREIARRIDTTSHNTVKRLLDDLEEMGYISREHERARRIDVLIDPFSAADGIPIKGEIVDGKLTRYELFEYVDCGKLFDAQCYMLLNDKSYLVIRRQRTAKQGQQVFIEYNDKVYVSSWNNQGGQVTFKIPRRTLDKKEVLFRGRVMGVLAADVLDAS